MNDTQAHWSGPSSIYGDADAWSDLPTRELLTRSSAPRAPTLATLYGHEATPPRQTLALWDAGRLWPAFDLAGRAGDGWPACNALRRIVLRQHSATEPMAQFVLGRLPGRDGDDDWGVVEARTEAGDPLALRLALTLLEQADRAVILAGGSADKELVRRIVEMVRSAPWSGPPLLMVTPADRPSRADRLRRAPWPKGLRVHVLEVFAGNSPGWTGELLALVTGTATPALQADGTLVPAAVAAAGAGASPPAPPAPNWAQSLLAAMPAAGDLPAEPARTPAMNAAAAPVPAGAGALPRALSLLMAAPGVLACALVDADSGTAGATAGLPEPAQALAHRAAAHWRLLHEQASSIAEAPTLLQWEDAAHLHLAQPLADAPRRLLAVQMDRRHGDAARVRWQLAIACALPQA